MFKKKKKKIQPLSPIPRFSKACGGVGDVKVGAQIQERVRARELGAVAACQLPEAGQADTPGDLRLEGRDIRRIIVVVCS